MKVNTFYLGRNGWTTGESLLPPSYPIENTFQRPDGQANPHVQLADMNGDRMLDLVCIFPEPSPSGQRVNVRFWPQAGLGSFGDVLEIPTTTPDSFDIGTVDVRDVLIEDFTGDGLADSILIEGNGHTSTLTLRVNIAGQRWSPPFRRAGLPRYEPRDPVSPTVLRLADFNANGSLDLLFRNTSPQDTWHYLELLPAGAPSILNQIDNSLGKRTKILYGTAAEDEQQARTSGHPWRTFAAIALQVVRRIETHCGLDLNGDGKEDAAVSEFHYRDPYYDGLEREFRGFAYAQRIDYGDDFLLDPVTGLMNARSDLDKTKTPTGQVSGPSLVTRYRFHTGAADQQDNDDYGSQIPAFRLIDEVTEVAGREEEVLKGLQVVEEKVDPVVLHSLTDGDFDAGCEAASLAKSVEGQGRLTPDAYVYIRNFQHWVVRRLYRPEVPLPYFADQNADGIMEDYQTNAVAPVPPGRFASKGTTVPASSARSVSFAIANRAVTQVHEANGLLAQALSYPLRGPIQTLKTFDYDDYGNQTELKGFGIDGGDYDDERFTKTTYAHEGNALARWIINKPDTISVTDEIGAFVSKKVHFYDGAPFVGEQGRIENRALLSRTIEFIDETNSVQASRSQYDEYGNLSQMRDPVGHVRRIGWDAAFKTFPVSEIIVVGGGAPDLKLEVSYDAGFGVVTNSTDFNGNATVYPYDSFARLVNIIRPGDSASHPTLRFDYRPADPIRGRAFNYESNGDLRISAVPPGSASRVTTYQREIAGAPVSSSRQRSRMDAASRWLQLKKGKLPECGLSKTPPAITCGPKPGPNGFRMRFGAWIFRRA